MNQSRTQEKEAVFLGLVPRARQGSSILRCQIGISSWLVLPGQGSGRRALTQIVDMSHAVLHKREHWRDLERISNFLTLLATMYVIMGCYTGSELNSQRR